MNQRGFTLVELLVSVTLMVIGVFAVVSMISVSMRSDMIANGIATKTGLAREVLEDITSRSTSDSVLITTALNQNYNFYTPHTLPGSSTQSQTTIQSATYTATYSVQINTPSSGVSQITASISGGSGGVVSMTSYKRVN
ncbi:hypothetical protein GURASL_26120 [Geotalea uraniireducens]|uniref:Prepilin-type N-terminal cleavage/methylation domain-containing protein n=2 Tax=Geotalea uraniireducens TaxID=351604 RepID=A0ABM8EN07_9BACT|nr:hypothetical protein GURASL_26120 [Geotalea uraniireducens]